MKNFYFCDRGSLGIAYQLTLIQSQEDLVNEKHQETRKECVSTITNLAWIAKYEIIKAMCNFMLYRL